MRYQRQLCLVSLLGIVGCAMASSTLAHQPAGPPGKVVGIQPERTPLQPMSPVTFSFGGGTADEYVAELRKAVQPQTLNVVFRGESSSMRLPALELANVSIGTAIETLQNVYDRRGDGTSLNISRVMEDGGAPVYIVMTRNSAGASGRAPQSTDVFSIRSLTEPTPNDPEAVPLTMSPDVVLSALEAILSIEPGEGKAATLKFHPDSGLVVVRANEEQLVLVRRAIGTMQEDADRRRRAYASIDIDGMQIELERAHIQLQRAVGGLEQAKQEQQMINQRVAAGAVPTTEAAGINGRVRNLELDVQSATLEVEMLQKRIDKMRKAQTPVSDDKSAK